MSSYCSSIHSPYSSVPGSRYYISIIISIYLSYIYMSSYCSSIHSTYFLKSKKNISKRIIPRPPCINPYIYPTIHLSIHASIYSLFIYIQFTYLSIFHPSINSTIHQVIEWLTQFDVVR